jgi:mannose-1-phosphate guanylyltransferase
MHAMVLAAGYGTRLRPLTLERAKPGVPVFNRPLACFALDAVARLGVGRAVLNTHHLGEALPEWIRPHTPPDLALRFVHEPTLLGTGGGLRNAWPLLRDGDDPVVVINGDILFAPDLRAVLDTHRRMGALATMVLRPDPNAARYGALDVDDEGRVRRLLGEPAWPGPLRSLMFTGVHVLDPRAFDDLPDQGCIVRACYRRWIDRGEVVAAHVDETPWRDLGTLPSYLEAHLELLRGAVAWEGAPAAPDGALVHPDAHVGAGAVLRETTVGAGAHIADGVRLTRCVVWDGARVAGDLTDAVVTREHVVAIPAP